LLSSSSSSAPRRLFLSFSRAVSPPSPLRYLLLLLLPPTPPLCIFFFFFFRRQPHHHGILSLLSTNVASWSPNKPTPIANAMPKRFLARYVFFDSSHSIPIHHPICGSSSRRSRSSFAKHFHLLLGEGKGSYHVLSLRVSWLHSLRDSLFEIRVLCRWSLCKLLVSCMFVLQVTMPKAPKLRKWMMRRNERTWTRDLNTIMLVMHLPLPCTSSVTYFVFNSNGINLPLGFSYCMIEYNHVSCLLDRKVRIWMKRRKNRDPRMFLGDLFRQKRNLKFLKMHQGMPIAVIFCSLCVCIIA